MAVSAISRAIFLIFAWQGQKDSNPRPSVLETDALPTELYPFRRARLVPEMALRRNWLLLHGGQQKGRPVRDGLLSV